jgi:hypothetical protein
MGRLARLWPTAWFSAIALLASVSVAAAVEVPKAQDLQADGEAALTRGMPIVLVVAQHNCGYCALLEREVLHPMIRSGEYEDRVLLREIDIASRTPVRDFDGTPIEPAELARRYGAFVTPTLLFLDPTGEELASKLVGVSTLDFYWSYLDEAIDTAVAALRDCDAEPEVPALVARTESIENGTALC